jgi:hypothetical protein
LGNTENFTILEKGRDRERREENILKSGNEGIEGIGKEQGIAPITGAPSPSTALRVAAATTATREAGTKHKENKQKQNKTISTNKT